MHTFTVRRATSARYSGFGRIPYHGFLDHTLALKNDPYRFISKNCRRYKTDVFQTRILFQPTLCMSGPEAAKLFYNPEHFQRPGAQPSRVQNALSGKKGVQLLNGEAHHHRKAMLMSLMTPERIRELKDIHTALWHEHLAKWTGRDNIALYPQVRKMLAQAICRWAGVPLDQKPLRRRSDELISPFHGTAVVGPMFWQAHALRKRADAWARRVIEDVRAGRLVVPESSAAFVIASYRDPSNNLLDPDTAAVELLNILKPTVAVAVFITFAAHAMHFHPDTRAKLGDDHYAEMFALEVRRHYPFFPSLIAQTAHDFRWNGLKFPAHIRTLLDVYGTNHDPRGWREPEKFMPERFENGDVTPFNFIPQGGGDARTGHRCPGEAIAMELIQTAGKFLAAEMAYDVPEQELDIDFSEVPAMVKSRFVISNVRRR